MASDREATERRVHVLPTELLQRVRSYQSDNGIPSEVEAVRRLLNEALQMRDSVEDLLRQLKGRWSIEKDLRILNREILSAHPLLKNVRIDDRELRFSLRNGQAGAIQKDGNVKIGEEDDNDYMRLSDYTLPRHRTLAQERARTSLENRKKDAEKDGWEPSGDGLDDEIPF